MQRRRRMIGYETAEEIAADCLFEAQGDVASAWRAVILLARILVEIIHLDGEIRHWGA